MEFEFDKEMDAILRRHPPAAAAASPATAHLDADTIAAFADNVLPQAVRSVMTEHLADCTRCRAVLSQTILLSEGLPLSAAPARVDEGVSAPAVPWYLKIFRTPNLAIAMGALLVVFTGALGYLLIESRVTDSNATVSQVTEQERAPAPDGLYATEQMASNTNSSSTTAAAPPSSVSNAVDATTAGTMVGTSANSAALQPPSEPKLAAAGEEKAAGTRPELTDSSSQPSGRVAAVPPPPPPIVTLDGADADEVPGDADDKRMREKDLELAKRKESSEDRGMYRRDAPAPAAKSGPARSGPLQSQTQNNAGLENSSSRVVGGKLFTKRSGAWYDSAYQSQATQNYRRGTDAYKDLDSGLRSIAQRLSGTVVIVWKGKAYRID